MLGEVPVPAPLTPEDVRLAVRALVVHAAEEWPSGPLCRNDGASFPCRLHRWGRRVLETHGLNERQIDALIRHGNPFVHVPFPFVVNGPSTARTGAMPARPGAGVPARPGTAAPPRTGTVPPRTGTVPPRTGAVPPRVGTVPPRSGVVPPRTAVVPPRVARPVPAHLRGQAGRSVPARVPGRPVAPPATAPRWPRAS
ncbi:ribosomal eL19 family protein [Micromonospora fluostatini]|uniref:hypothetical protein n=1 Tax=Micromonospora sp. JCM 30529 TaxID=3421643 RepID=UPI003D1643FA